MQDISLGASLPSDKPMLFKKQNSCKTVYSNTQSILFTQVTILSILLYAEQDCAVVNALDI